MTRQHQRARRAERGALGTASAQSPQSQAFRKYSRKELAKCRPAKSRIRVCQAQEYLKRFDLAVERGQRRGRDAGARGVRPSSTRDCVLM